MSQFATVGGGPAFPVSVKGVAVQYGRVLLLENERAEWELPGGKLELGEDPQECVVRESGEETGWQVTPGPILDCWQYHIRENFSVVIVTYGCHVASNRPPVVSTEHKRARLFALAEVPRLNMPAGYKRSVTDWFNRLDSPGPHLATPAAKTEGRLRLFGGSGLRGDPVHPSTSRQLRNFPTFR